MSEVRELYQQVILDHNKNPSNFHQMNEATHKAEGYNPLCGDRYVIYLKIQNDVIEKASFQGSGCAISTSSASIMTELLPDKTIQEAMEIIKEFQKMLRVDQEPAPETGFESKLGKAVVLAGVKEFPTRLKCATLAWHTSKSAIQGEKSASTE